MAKNANNDPVVRLPAVTQLPVEEDVYPEAKSAQDAPPAEDRVESLSVSIPGLVYESDEAPEQDAEEKGGGIVKTFISSFLVACIIIIAVALIAVKVSGCYLFTIETGSMSPTYPVNTVVLVKPCEFEEIRVGDVVTYVMNESGDTVTHRVVKINTNKQTLTTQGDANNAADVSPVLYENVVGKVIGGIPNIGVVIKVITDDDNRNIILAIIILLFAAVILSSFIGDGRRKRKKQQHQLP